MRSWSEHVVPEGLGHVLVANDRGVEAVKLQKGGEESGK